MRRLFFIFSILFLFISHSREQKNPCGDIKEKEPITHFKAMECIQSVPFDSKIREKTIKSLKFVYNGYVYKDIVLKAPPPFNTSVDVEQKLLELDLKKPIEFEHDYDFHSQIRNIFSSLYDAHTAYIPPLCYSTFFFFLPFQLAKIADKYYIDKLSGDEATGILEKYQVLFPDRSDLYLSKYVGYEITHINSIPIDDYLIDFANTGCFYSRDHSIRFNQVLKAEFHQRTAQRNQLPDMSFYTFRIINASTSQTQELEVHWMAIPALDYTVLPMKVICGYFDENDESSEARSIINGIPGMHLRARENINYNHVNDFYMKRIFQKNVFKEHINSNIRRSHEEVQSIHFTDEFATLEAVELKHDDIVDYIGLYMLTKPSVTYKTGVLVVKTFMPDLLSADAALASLSYKYYVEQLNDAFEQMKKSGATKVIVDTRGNPGGIVCLGFVLARFLSPYAPIDGSPQGDMLVTEVGTKLHCPYNVLDKLSFFDQNRMPVSGDWYRQGTHHKRGGKNKLYSSLIHFGCQFTLFLSSAEYYWENSPIQFEPENIVILTDGTCGSTCGVFVKMFQYLHLGRIVSQGGIPDRQMGIASFKAAAVKTLNSTVSELYSSLFCFEAAEYELDEFPSTAMFSYSWFEIYPWEPIISAFELERVKVNTPMGFTSKSADHHIYNWDFTFRVYPSLLPFFQVCNEWEKKKNDDCNDSNDAKMVFGNPCVSGTFDMTRCVKRGCIKGYYLSMDGTECLSMPKEYDVLYDIRNLVISGIILVTLFCFCCCFCCFMCFFFIMIISCKFIKPTVERQDGDKLELDVKYDHLPEEDDFDDKKADELLKENVNL